MRLILIPLWNIHRLMQSCKRQAEDEFAIRVGNLEEQIRSSIDSDEDVAAAKNAKDKLEIMRAIDPNITGYPVWPFQAITVFRLFSPQLLSTAAGLGLTIYGVIDKF